MDDRNEGAPNEGIPDEASANKANFTTCAKCGLLIVGQFVRALGGTYHLECFKCQDCGAIVASKFFPIEGPDGKQQPLCERDYFRGLNLICENCDGALRGSYITALDKKYHIEHFTCSACPTVFGPQDSYYEHDGHVYCHYHYSTRFAVKCVGCQTAILKQFVEINRNSIDEHWHPECYMIHKFWNVRLSTRTDDDQHVEIDEPSAVVDTKVSPEELKKQQKEMEEKVYNIWTILSAFEEMSAACISDMLQHVSNGSYFECVKMSERFVNHVEILFFAIDDLEVQSVQASGQGLQYHREAKMLCKKIHNFFSVLSDAYKRGIRKLGISQDLLALVTGLAQFLKVLIRTSLTGALKLERDFDGTAAIKPFLKKLGEFTKGNGEQNLETNIDNETSSGLCHACRISVEEECYKYGPYRWHIGCLRCTGCSRELRTIYRDATFNQITEMAFCPNDTNEQATPGFQHVTQLEQYVYLLRVGLFHLHGQLKQDEDNSLSGYDGHRGQKEEAGPARKNSLASSYSSGDKTYETTHSTDIKRTKTVTLARVATRSRVEEFPSTPKNSNDSAKEKLASQLQVRIIDDKMPESQAQDTRLKFDSENESIMLGDIAAIASAEMAASEGAADETKIKARGSSRPKSYISELSDLQYCIVKHVAALCMEQTVKDYCTLDELLELSGTKKANIWTKFMTSIKSNEKKPVKKKDAMPGGTFGVPLEVLVERYGVDSVLGAGPGTIRIPSFVDDSISAMKTMDMSVEGIFRKNGNIRRLKDLSEAIDMNPSSVNLSEDNPVQVAALMKKFLRDLPDPLLTFKLHKLFVISQKLDKEADRKKILHLICCLLPKANRDTMEVLFIFFKWVASFSHVDEETGSKMDLHNLATVITPNILYSKSKDPIKDDSFLAIEAVHCLLKYQDDFWVVPEEISMILHDKELKINNNDNLTQKDILKRCENLVKKKLDGNDNDKPSSSDDEKPVRKHASDYPYHGSEGKNKSSPNLHASSTSLTSEASIPIEQRVS